MKRLWLSLCFCLTGIVVIAQGIDKPKYQIDVYRLSNFLGTIQIELFPLVTPLHVNNFDSLVGQQFYDSTAFHRVVPGFVIQGGDPNSISGPISTWGNGQPWQPTVNAEFNSIQHLRGIIGAARDTDPNSANSQFYICVASATFLDGNYTVFGRVTSGMNIADSIALSPRDINDVPTQKLSMFVTAIGTNPSIPAVPLLDVPADSAMLVLNTQSFSWSAVDSAVLYTIQFSTDSLFSTVAYSDTLPLTQITFPSMSGTTQYFWRVRSNNGGHESPWSNVRTFYTATGAAIGIYPQNVATGIPVNLSFVWTSVPGAATYFLQVARTPLFTGTSVVFSQAGIVDTTQLVTGLLPGRRYYWRVQSIDSSGVTGMLTPNYYFTTGTSTGINEITSSGLTINGPWPNPAKSTSNLQVLASEEMAAGLMLKDLMGRTIQHQQLSLHTGTNDLQFSVEGFRPGIYLIELKMESGSDFRQLVIE